MKKLTKGSFGKLPKLSLYTIFAMTFGFFGINITGTLQFSQMGRVFQTIGANPTHLGFYFLLPPLMGMIVQPLIGKFSDRTWCRFGRRIPYLLIGMPIAVFVLIMFPNAGSFGFGYGSLWALSFGCVAIALMDLSNNVCMQPFKMIIGDMVGQKQQDKAWAWQQVFSNCGGLLASFLPAILTSIGLSNVAKHGDVPTSVKVAFYIGAASVFLTTLYTIFSVKEYNPKQYAYYHGIKESEESTHTSLWTTMKNAPRTFWEICLVQLFSWISYQYLTTYGTGALAKNIWHTSNPSTSGFQDAGNWFGIMNAVMAVTGILYGSFVLAHVKPNKRKKWYSLGLLIGGLGLVSIFFVTNKYLMILPFILVSVGQITMNVEPFSIFTASLSGENEGYYLGLFNCGICLPQIIASFLSTPLMKMVSGSMPLMVLIAGAVMIMGAISVGCVHPVIAQK